MTKMVRDVDLIKHERCKALVANCRNIALIFLAGAAIRLYNDGWEPEGLTIGYAVAGVCLIILWRYLKVRWRGILSWRPDRQ